MIVMFLSTVWTSDRPILIFYKPITDTDYLYVYVPDNRYAEPNLFTVIKYRVN